MSPLEKVKKLNIRRCEFECDVLQDNICCYDCEQNKGCEESCEQFVHQRSYLSCNCRYNETKEI